LCLFCNTFRFCCVDLSIPLCILIKLCGLPPKLMNNLITKCTFLIYRTRASHTLIISCLSRYVSPWVWHVELVRRLSAVLKKHSSHPSRLFYNKTFKVCLKYHLRWSLISNIDVDRTFINQIYISKEIMFKNKFCHPFAKKGWQGDCFVYGKHRPFIGAYHRASKPRKIF